MTRKEHDSKCHGLVTWDLRDINCLKLTCTDCDYVYETKKLDKSIWVSTKEWTHEPEVVNAPGDIMILPPDIKPVHKCRKNCRRKECRELLLKKDPLSYERCSICDYPFPCSNGYELDISRPRGLKVMSVIYMCIRCFNKFFKKIEVFGSEAKD